MSNQKKQETSLLQDMIQGMAASKSSPGMSQERTEPYTFTFDETEQMFMKFFVENSTHTLTVRRQQEALADLLTARREIDRLNAVNAEQAEYIDAINKASDGLDTAVYLHMCHIERLEAVIVGQASALREQTAKVQERDKYIESLTARYIALGADLDKRDKEIERLRTVGEEAAQIIENVGFPNSATNIRAALKGAE